MSASLFDSWSFTQSELNEMENKRKKDVYDRVSVILHAAGVKETEVENFLEKYYNQCNNWSTITFVCKTRTAFDKIVNAYSEWEYTSILDRCSITVKYIEVEHINKNYSVSHNFEFHSYHDRNKERAEEVKSYCIRDAKKFLRKLNKTVNSDIIRKEILKADYSIRCGIEYIYGPKLAKNHKKYSIKLVAELLHK